MLNLSVLLILFFESVKFDISVFKKFAQQEGNPFAPKEAARCGWKASSRKNKIYKPYKK